MKTKIKYTDEPIEIKVVKDFLPSPSELAFREESVKVTIYADVQSEQRTKHSTGRAKKLRAG